LYHGVLAPRARWRSQVVRYARPAPDGIALTLEATPHPAGLTHAWTWAALMRRVFALDVLACPRCGGRLRAIATVQDQAVVRAILAHLGLAPGPDSPGRPCPSPITPWPPGNPPGSQSVSRSTTATAARAAVCPAHASLDDVPVARAPSPGSAIKIARCPALSQGDAGIPGPLQAAAGGRSGFNVSYAPGTSGSTSACARSARASPASRAPDEAGRLDYGAIGTVTNLAARLCGEAGGGQILVSARVAAAVEDMIDAEGGAALKGLARPVPTWSVRGLISPGPATPST
jgi:hypothetical protein